MAEEDQPGLMGRMSRLQKAGALVIGLLLAGGGAGVWYANFQAAYATRDALKAHASAVEEALEELEEDTGNEVAELAQGELEESEKMWKKIGQIEARANTNGVMLEMLLLYEERGRARHSTRRAIDRRLDRLRSGTASPPSNPLDPFAGVREEL